MTGWRAWMADGSVYDSMHTSWADLPPTGVVAVIVYENEQYQPGHYYQRAYYGRDRIWRNPKTGEVGKSDLSSLTIQAQQGISADDIKEGANMDETAWLALLDRVMASRAL